MCIATRTHVVSSTGVDDLRTHVSHPDGDHQRAHVAYMRERPVSPNAPPPNADSCEDGMNYRKLARDKMQVPDELMNAVVFCSACMVDFRV